VKYTIPDAVPIFVAVSLQNNAQLPAGIVGLVQQAIIAAFAGEDGGARAKIGSTVYASRYYAPVALLGPYVEILSIFVGIAATPTGNSVAININQIATVTAADITVTLV
jgi:hypothetical protein